MIADFASERRLAGAMVAHSSMSAWWTDSFHDRYLQHDRRYERPQEPFAVRWHEFQEMQLDVRAALHKLPFKTHFVLCCRFGLLDGAEMTLEEIGVVLKLTRERVRQIEAKGLRLLGGGSTKAALHEWWEDSEGKFTKARRMDVAHLATSLAEIVSRTAECEGCGREGTPLTRAAVDGLTLCAMCFHDAVLADMETT